MIEITEAEQALLDAIADAGYDTRSYGGRGMGNKRCASVTLDSEQEMRGFIAATMRYVPEEFYSEAIDFFASSLTDNMGRGLVLYFPDVEME